ncbi:MAG TPA: hypothetical protein ENJ18_05895, partial [Nannocystis exedens]|nr:hypothetical protein [Nannocystis exedens]
MKTRIRLSWLTALSLVSATVGACTDPPLISESESDGLPTSTMPYDPSQGGASGTTGATDSGTGTNTTSGETDPTTTGEPMPPMCDEAQRRCAYEFTYPDGGELSVDVMGNYAADGWTVGRAMETDGRQWSVSIELPWDTPVEYKLRIDNDMWIPDPNNPDTVDDGFGGLNSVVMGMTCEWWSCDSGNIGTFDWRDAVIYFVFVDR